MVQDPNQRRRQATEDDDGGGNEQPKKSGLNTALIVPIAVSVVLSLILVYFLFNPGGKMSKADVTKSLDLAQTEMTKTVTDLIAPFKNLKTDITNTTTQQINSALAGLPTSQSVTNAQNTADAAKLNADKALSLANQVQSDSTTYQGKIVASQSDIINLQTANKKLTTDLATTQSDLDATKKSLNDLTTKVNAMPTPTTTSTSNSSVTSAGSATSADGLVKASIISYTYTNIFNDSSSAPPVLTFSSASYGPYLNDSVPPNNNATIVSINGANKQWINSSNSQQFQLQLQNNTGKTISNIALQLAFVFIKSDGTQVTLPTGVTYGMASMGNPQWTNVGSDPTYTAWATGSSNTILSGIWNFTQGTGSNSYYSTLSISLPIVTDPTQVLSMNALTWYAVPLIKVVSYS